MAIATWSIQVSWAGQNQGQIRIGSSTLGGPDVIGGTFGGTAFDAIGDAVTYLKITRGKPSDFSGFQQGSCIVRLLDLNGSYNPLNPASSLAGMLLPMRPLRVQAAFGGTTYGLFSGWITRIEHNPDPAVHETLIEARDLFEWLNAAFPVIATRTNTTVSQIIGAILDSIGWSDPALRNLQVGGDSIPTWSAGGTTSALALIQALLQTDLGWFFIDGQGRAAYLARQTVNSNRPPLAALDATFVGGLRAAVDVKNIINSITVTRNGGAAQTFSDTASQHQYGSRVAPPITSANLQSDAQALNLATWLVTARKQPLPPGRQVRLFNRDAASLAQQLARELGDVVTISEAQGNTSLTGIIARLEHEVFAGLRHTTTYVVQQQASNSRAFTVGVSSIGSSDVVNY